MRVFGVIFGILILVVCQAAAAGAKPGSGLPAQACAASFDRPASRAEVAAAKLGASGREAIRSYSYFGSSRLNSYLRSGRSDSAELEARISALESALKTLPRYRGTVFRFIRPYEEPWGRKYRRFVENIADQGVFSDPGFLSCSAAEDAGTYLRQGFGGRILPPSGEPLGKEMWESKWIRLEIESRNGRMLPPSLVTRPGEFEVLFLPGTEFEVVGARWGDYGEAYIQLRELP